MLWDGLIVALDRYFQNITKLDQGVESQQYCDYMAELFSPSGAGHDLVKLICSGLPGLDYSLAIAPTSTDQFAATIHEMCLLGLGVNIDVDFARDMFAPFCITMWQPCLFLAKTVARCDCMEHILGVSLRTRLRAHLHESQFGFEFRDHDRGLHDLLLTELLAAKKELAELKASIARGVQHTYLHLPIHEHICKHGLPIFRMLTHACSETYT